MNRVMTVLLIAMLGVPAAAQSQVPQQSAPPAAVVDASKLGVSLDRIRRHLRRAEASTNNPDALKLEFTVEVYGRAPRINLLENFPLHGPNQYGGPTHQEVVSFLTPQAFSSPRMALSNAVYKGAQKLWQRSKKQQCEDALAEYRALVMQGVPTAPPRCAQ